MCPPGRRNRTARIKTTNFASRDAVPIISSAAIILSINALRDPGLETTRDDLQFAAELIQVFHGLESGRENTYLPQVRIACEELYRRAKVASQPLERQLPLTPQRRAQGGQSRVPESHCQKGPAETHAVPGLTTPNNRLTPTPQQRNGADSTFGFEPRSSDVGFGSAEWAHPGQTSQYPALIPWSLDILLEGSFGDSYQA